MKLLLLLSLCLSTLGFANNFESNFANQASKFLDALDPEQRSECLLPADDPKRWKMQYTGGKRAGLAIGKLNESQKQIFHNTLKLILSKEGWDMAQKVALQDGHDAWNNYYIACFGDPRESKNFTFRLAEHHLTIVHISFQNGATSEFGPILLGANPASLWKKDELALMELWKKANDPSLLIKGKKAIASRAMPKGDGKQFSTLNTTAQEQLKHCWDLRLRIFTPEIKSILNRHLKENGGFKSAKLAFYNRAPTQRCIDGGKWDFNCQIGKLLFDYEGSRSHIHMSLWVR